MKYKLIYTSSPLIPLLPIEVQSLTINSQEIVCNPPLILRPKFDQVQGCYYAAYSKLGFFVVAHSDYSNFLEEIRNNFFFAWREYAEKADEELTEYGKYVKANWLELIGGQSE